MCFRFSTICLRNIKSPWESWERPKQFPRKPVISVSTVFKAASKDLGCMEVKGNNKDNVYDLGGLGPRRIDRDTATVRTQIHENFLKPKYHHIIEKHLNYKCRHTFLL